MKPPIRKEKGFCLLFGFLQNNPEHANVGRARSLLDGVRGQPPVDKDAIVDTLMRIGQLVQDFPEILELDINPLMVYSQGQGGISIDMRLVLSKDTGKGA